MNTISTLRTSLRRTALCLLAGAMPLLGACGAPDADGTAPELTGEVQLSISAAPSDAQCLQLTTTVGANTVNSKFTLIPGRASSAVATGLPVGAATLRVQVFTTPCASTTTPKWESNSKTATLLAGELVSIEFDLHLVGAGGIVSIDPEFPKPLAEFERLIVAGTTSYVNLVIGPDNAIWYYTAAASAYNTIYSLQPGAGAVSKYAFTPNDLTAFTLGPDSRIWVARQTQIVRMDPWSPGIQTTYTVPSANANVSSIVTGPDGNLWFTEKGANKIGRVTVLGVFTEFTLPVANSLPDKITAGPDGNLWFVETARARIGRITPAGTITEFTLASGSAPEQITAGADGNLWITLSGSNKIGRITPTGTITEFAVPTAAANLRGIALGPDGNIWFGKNRGLGRVTPAGVITELDNVSGTSSPTSHIVRGPDGYLYFGAYDDPLGFIGRIRPSALP